MRPVAPQTAAPLPQQPVPQQASTSSANSHARSFSSQQSSSMHGLEGFCGSASDQRVQHSATAAFTASMLPGCSALPFCGITEQTAHGAFLRAEYARLQQERAEYERAARLREVQTRAEAERLEHERAARIREAQMRAYLGFPF